MRGTLHATWMGLTLVALGPVAARADDGRSFVWQAPEGCPSSPEVEARIEARLHRGSAWSVRGQVVREDNQVRVRLTTPSGERVLTAPTCEQAAEAVAVIVALAVEGTTPGAPSPEPSIADAPRRPAELAQPAAIAFAFGTAFDSSSLPHPSPGLAVGVGLAKGPLTAALDLSGFLPQTERSPGDPPVSASVGLVDVMASGCAVTRSSGVLRVEVGGCVAAGVGFLPASSDGITSPKAGWGVRPEVMVAARAAVRLGDHAALRAQGGPLAGLARPPFEVTGVGDVYRPPTWTLRASLGLEMQFW